MPKSSFVPRAHRQAESPRFVKQDSNMRSDNSTNVISSAWRHIRLGAQEAFARVKTVPCDECWRTVRWWNRRVWLGDSKGWVHLQCWKGQFFFKAMVADHIRYIQAMAEENSPLSRNHSPGNKLQELHGNAAPREQVKGPVLLLHPANEIAAETGVDETQPGGNLFRRELRTGLWHFLGRVVPQRLPNAPRLCALCGTFELSGKSTFCTRCGTPFRSSN